MAYYESPKRSPSNRLQVAVRKCFLPPRRRGVLLPSSEI
jgi:hypothetical protein